MARQSITLTKPNDEWLKAQVDSQEYTSKSEVVNDLIRKARRDNEEIKLIRAKLIEGEKSGFTDKSAPEILSDFKAKARQDGKL